MNPGDLADQAERGIDGRAIDREDAVLGAQTRARRWPRRLYARHHDAGRRRVSLRIRDTDTQPATVDMPALFQLRHDPFGQLARDSEADADRAAGRGNDGGGHADDLTRHVEGGSAGVAGIDRRIELQEVVERPAHDVAPTGGDYAGGDGAAEAEGIAGD